MKLSKQDLIKILASLAAFVLLVFIFIREIPYNINTFNRVEVVLISIGAGIVTGILLALYFKRYAEELIAKFQIFVSLAVMCAIFFPSVLSMVNRIQVTETGEHLTYVETREVYGMVFKGRVDEDGQVSADSYDIVVERENGQEESIRFSSEISSGWERGQTADITVHRGLLGIHFVYPE